MRRTWIVVAVTALPCAARAQDAGAAPERRWSVAFTLPDSDFVAEDIVFDARARHFLVSSVRHGHIVAITERGASRRLVTGTPGWSTMALGIDQARGRLWTTAVSWPQAVGFVPADSGKSAVVRYDLAGRVIRRYDLPSDGTRRAPGDLAVASNGDVFIADGHHGELYVIREGRDTLEVLVARGTFRSPQGPAPATDGRRVYLADYSRGIAIVDRATGAVSWLAADSTVNLRGIDGLAAHGGALLAVQNGTRTHRVLRLTLDAAGNAVVRAEALAQDPAVINEPTHGVVVGEVLFVIAASGWAQLAENGAVKPGERLVPSPVIRIPLASRP